MACSATLSSYQLSDCFSSKGGVTDVWVAIWTKDMYTVTSAGTVSGFATGTTWYHQSLRRNQSSLTSTFNYDENAGSNYVSTEAVWVYNKMDKENRVQMNALIKSDLAVIVKDANGEYLALGVDEPVRATAGTGETGTDRGDRNAFEITVTDYNKDFPQHLDSAAIELLP